MSNVIWIMQSDRDDFKLLPPDIQRLVLASESVGFSNFWYHPDHGLLADGPENTIEDDRILVTWETVEYYRGKGRRSGSGGGHADSLTPNYN